MYVARYLNQTKHPEAIKLLALYRVLSLTPALCGTRVGAEQSHDKRDSLRNPEKHPGVAPAPPGLQRTATTTDEKALCRILSGP